MADGSQDNNPQRVQEPRRVAPDQTRQEARPVDEKTNKRVGEPQHAADGQLHEPGYGHGV